MSIQPGSRYEEAEKNFVIRHYYDQYGHPLMEDVTGNIHFVRSSVQATYLLNVLPAPPPPPAEYYAKQDEHMPLLAYKFMEDSTRWWEIAEVNPQLWYPLDMSAGSYIKIPS
jgi:hypothetical protein